MSTRKNSAMPGAGTPFAETGPLELGEGEEVMLLKSLYPDEETLGDVEITLTAKDYPNDTPRVHGPYTASLPIEPFITGRQISLKYVQAREDALECRGLPC